MVNGLKSNILSINVFEYFLSKICLVSLKAYGIGDGDVLLMQRIQGASGQLTSGQSRGTTSTGESVSNPIQFVVFMLFWCRISYFGRLITCFIGVHNLKFFYMMDSKWMKGQIISCFSCGCGAFYIGSHRKKKQQWVCCDGKY